MLNEQKNEFSPWGMLFDKRQPYEQIISLWCLLKVLVNNTEHKKCQDGHTITKKNRWKCHLQLHRRIIENVSLGHIPVHVLYVFSS